MGFFAAARSCLAWKYAVFDGRAPRSEFWWFHLLIVLLAVLLAAALVALGEHSGEVPGWLGQAAAIVAGLLQIGLFLPSLAVAIRRLHDVDRSGWNFFWSFVPLIGSILLLIWFCRPGTRGANRYGLDPLHER